MALNEIYKDANELVFGVHSSVKSGDLVKVGELTGVAQNDAVVGEDGNSYATLKLNGAFKVSADPTVTLYPGQKAYSDFAQNTGIGGFVTNDSSAGQKFVGHIIKIVDSDYAVVRLAQN